MPAPGLEEAIVNSVAHDPSRQRQGAHPGGALGHLVTISPSGIPQVTCVWVAVEGDELLTAHLNPRL
jgi:hypothetical protein